jgi:hypothetical protein
VSGEVRLGRAALPHGKVAVAKASCRHCPAELSVEAHDAALALRALEELLAMHAPTAARGTGGNGAMRSRARRTRAQAAIVRASDVGSISSGRRIRCAAPASSSTSSTSWAT